MGERRLFPASIVDELTYCVEGVASGLHFIYSWILTLEGEVSTEVSQEALDKALNYYPKCKCILVNNYPSYQRWFRYRWKYTEVRGKDIVEEVTLSDPNFTIEKAVNYYMHNHVPLSIDLSTHIPKDPPHKDATTHFFFLYHAPFRCRRCRQHFFHTEVHNLL